MKKLSVVGYRGLAVWAIMCFGGLLNIGLGQGLRYSFKAGETLDYDLIERVKEIKDYGPQYLVKTWKYRFTVDSVSVNSFWLTMKYIGFYSGDYWISDRIARQESQNTTYGRQSDVFHGLYSIEIRHPISFSMDISGKISKVKGVDSLFDAIVNEAIKNPDIRRSLEYNRVKARYSQDYYRWMIQEFFPAIPGSLKDTVSLKFGNRIVSRVNTWNSEWSRSRDSSNTFRLRRGYFFKANEEFYSEFQSKDTENDLDLTWTRDPAGYPVRMEYSGYMPEFLAMEVSFQGGSLDGEQIFRNIEIINTSRTDNRTQKVKINGCMLNIGDKGILAFVPGNRISKMKIPITLQPDGKFYFDFDLDVPSGLIEIFYEKPPMEKLWNSPGNPNQIRIFVKPGDTIDFSVDLNNPGSLEFGGHSKYDQMALNQLSKNLSPGDPKLSMQTTVRNMNFLAQRKATLSPEFLRFMEVENRYSYLSCQVEEFTRSGFGQNLSPMDSLPRFIKYLNYPDGYKSDAYKEFISDLVTAYGTSKILKIFGYTDRRNFDLSASILNGWDLYWYSADLAEYRLEQFPDTDYDGLYLRFSEIYPGTEFQNQLYQKYQSTEKCRIGTTIPTIKFEDFSGRKHSTKEFAGQNWIIVNRPVEIKNYKGISNLFKHVSTSNFQKVTIVICSPVIDSADQKRIIEEFRDKPFILVRNSKKGRQFQDYLKNLPEMLIGVDGNNRIAAYGSEIWQEIETLNTWPRLPKTINLKVSWYSLGGAFILSLCLVLAIRIRSSRKEKQLILKRKMAQLEVDAVRSRMNPHFLFNALSSIQNLINKKQIEEANLYLARFGDLVRTILTQSSKPAIGLNEEIDMIRNYLQLEQLRFPFEFDIQIDPSLDIFAIEVPPLLIQPHVENAVMHGISALGKDGRINITFRNENDHLICEVRDNGPGYHPGAKTGNGGLGQGWKLTRQRIQLMKEQYGEDVSVEVQSPDKENGDSDGSSGTTVIFRLPMQKSAR